eukprot:370813-Rhodomonas_salina.1
MPGERRGYADTSRAMDYRLADWVKKEAIQKGAIRPLWTWTDHTGKGVYWTTYSCKHRLHTTSTQQASNRLTMHMIIC